MKEQMNDVVSAENAEVGTSDEVMDLRVLEQEAERSIANKPRSHPMTPEAYSWMISPDSIPGAKAPILYVGPNKINIVWEALGRSLELEEVKLLVRPDGRLRECAVDGVEFQPIMYLAYLTDEDAAKLRAGVALKELDLRFGGSFYFHKGAAVAVSGAIYWCKSGRYITDMRSALMKAADAGKQENRGRPKWGYTLEYCNRLLAIAADAERKRQQERRKQEQAQINQRNQRVNELFGSKQKNGHGLGRGSDGFKHRPA